ncbi:MAG: hypothetical protein ACLFVN_04925 [Phycisphaeraceae bacterium]
MFMLRKLLKLVRGQVTPLQVMVACTLGAAIGFMPGLAQAPGLLLVLTLLLVLLNTPLLLAGVVAGLAAVASLLLLPVSFQVGRFLLDGPAQPVFEVLINAPVLALFGFEYYATTGGLVVGLLLGALLGAGVNAGLGGFRRKMAALEQGSDRYQQWIARRWVRVLAWLVAGRGPKQGYQAMLEARRRTQPVRLLAVPLVLGVFVLAAVGSMFFSGPLVRAALQGNLERAHGATVDVASAEASLREGRLVVEGLAMADPSALETDLFRAARLEADFSVSDLLRRRVSIDRVVLSEARSGVPRQVPGVLTRPRPQTPPPEPDSGGDPGAEPGGDKTLDDYLAEAEQWRDRLRQLRRWLERIDGGDQQPATGESAAGEPGETLRERLARRVREAGYAQVRAEHLVEGAPTLLVREMLAEKIRLTQLEGETLDVRGTNLSTHPRLVEAPPAVRVSSSGGRLLADVVLESAAAGGADRASRILFELRGVSGDRIGKALAVDGTPPISGGTLDLTGDGAWLGGTVDLPFEVTLHDATLAAPGIRGRRVGRLSLPLGIRGPLDNPQVLLDEDTLADALARAGADELARRARGEARRVIDEATDDATKRLPGEAGRLLRGLIGSQD